MTEQVIREKADQDSLKFIDEAVESELLYVFVTDNNCLQTDSTEFVDENEEPLVAVPVWSKSFLAEAQKWAGEEAVPEEMTLDYFINEFIPQLEESHCTIGLNWDNEGVGREFAPFDLTDMLVRKMNGEEIELPEHLVDDEQEAQG
jgi:hypothetical protein